MEALIGIILSFFGKIFTDVLNEQLTTEAETYEIEDEKGILENDVELDDLINEFDGL